MPHDRWAIGWDIGGAHLKVVLADAEGFLHNAATYYTPIWQGLDRLDPVLEQAVKGLPGESATHAVTMTGELVDLFACREQGVAALSERIAAQLPRKHLYFYAGPKGLIAPELASSSADLVASANWHATATLAAGRLSDAVVVDIGSTTTDLIPIIDGRLRFLGYSDRERLARQELIYSGVVRTPVMSLANRVPFAGDWVELAAELFSSTADVYRLTGELPEHADIGETVDGRGKSPEASAGRLARMIGEDAKRHEPGAWRALARYLRDCQLERISQALARQCSLGLADDAPLLGAGVGRFLARRLAQRLERPYLDVSTLFAWRADGDSAGPGAGAADCAPAAALALLARRLTDATID
jgi:probable H4MPT-linked C1 transfer pathway protein